jgi:hypothetical protein
MGCDIHLYVERQSKEHGRWELVVPPDTGYDFSSKLPYDDIMAAAKAPYRHKRNGSVDPQDMTWFDDRNYRLFGYLSGVRGDPMSDTFVDLLDRDGEPPDPSDCMRNILETWAPDAHSHFWGTLDELNWFRVRLGTLFAVVPDRGRAELDRQSFRRFFQLLDELNGLTEDPRRLRIVAFYDN